ncbi:hypothetical protein BDN70DRAFT_221438 [Pholiota conissans]|uniref:Uncharacterized protein n=1 Tax=Pholiota conissans TaxID=109636 RepID=A0A9P5YUB2_9AGAR|nr:hypothetical protein BDN70DRAFT_221438 [Pholiota conissans]
MNHLPMPHSFVAAKITPRLPLCSTHGQRIATSLTQASKPFLALHVRQNSVEDFVWGGANLFVVAREKPGVLGVESEYFVVGGDSGELKAGGNENENENENENVMKVAPPLPFEGPLYLWITPRIYAAVSNKEEYKRRITQSNADEYRYHLDEASVERFRRALRVAGPSIPVVKRTGGDDLGQPGDKWDTWSGETPREVENPIAPTSGRPVLFFFDLIPLDGLGSGCGLGGECVFDELFLLRQYVLYYIH